MNAHCEMEPLLCWLLEEALIMGRGYPQTWMLEEAHGASNREADVISARRGTMIVGGDSQRCLTEVTFREGAQSWRLGTREALMALEGL